MTFTKMILIALVSVSLSFCEGARKAVQTGSLSATSSPPIDFNSLPPLPEPCQTQTCNLEIGKEYNTNEGDLAIVEAAGLLAKKPTAISADEFIEQILIGQTAKAAQNQLPNEVVRMFHSKAHACLQAKWIAEKTVPDEFKKLQVGVFAAGAEYDAWLRPSNGAGNTPFRSDDDRNPPSLRGFAIKLVGVDGAKLIDQQDQNSQDFTLASSKENTFFSRTVADYLLIRNKTFPQVCPTCVAALADSQSQGKIENPLGVTYGSCVPSLIETDSGPVGVKYFLRPCNTDDLVSASNLNGGNSSVNPHFLRGALLEQLSPDSAKAKAVCMEFGVEVQSDACKMPVEDSSVPWNGEKVVLAKLHIGLQRAPLATTSAYCENMAFNPWHGLTKHRPAGSVSRARRNMYLKASAGRLTLNHGSPGPIIPGSGCPAKLSDALLSASPGECPIMAARREAERRRLHGK